MRQKRKEVEGKEMCFVFLGIKLTEVEEGNICEIRKKEKRKLDTQRYKRCSLETTSDIG